LTAALTERPANNLISLEAPFDFKGVRSACCSRVGDGVANPVPCHSAIVIAGGREFVGAPWCLLKYPLALMSTE
jgi:hypothetical protein